MPSYAIQKPIKYILELFRESEYDPRLAIADIEFSRVYNIYHFSIAPHPTSGNYWLDWGGTFDNPTSEGIQIFFSIFLTEVFLESNLISTMNSFYVDGANDKIYFHLPRKPWRYLSAVAVVLDNLGSTFSSAPKDEANLSDIKYGLVSAEPRLSPMKLSNKLSDTISGIVVYNSFKVKIDNTDGAYDGFDVIRFFNTPAQVSKTSEDAQTIAEFNRVRFGIIDDIKVDFKSITITATDQFYKMNKEFCRRFTTDDYSNLPESNVNKLIPVGWGDLKKIELFEVNKDTINDPPEWIDYIVLDPDFISAVSAVYDEDGNELTHTFTAATGIIRVTELDGDGEVIEAESVDVTGKTDNSIFDIITFALDYNENITFTTGIWDVTEAERYGLIAPTLDFYFDGGSTRDLIKEVLKNDLAYLIQKNDGLLTLRQWGQEYDSHYLPSWLTTQTPTKNFQDASKYFCSSVEISYDKNYDADVFQKKYLDDSMELEIFEKYRRSYTLPLEVQIDNETDVEDLADRLLDRFGEVRETIKIGVGVDTYAINLLDTVQYEGVVNDRNFSEYSTWIVKEADPGQDELVMEGFGITYLMTFDDVPAQIDKSYWGVDEDDVD